MIWNLPASKNLKTAAAFSGLLAAGLAHPGCGDAPAAGGRQHSSTRGEPAVYRADGLLHTAFMTVGDQWFEDASIVALWEFEVHLKARKNGLPDGFLFDWGLAMWHEEGTEMQFSAGRPPSAGDLCMVSTGRSDAPGSTSRSGSLLAVGCRRYVLGPAFNEKGTPLAVFNATMTTRRVTVK